MAVQISRVKGKAMAVPQHPIPAYDEGSPAAVRNAFLRSAIPESIPLEPLTSMKSARQYFDVQMTGLAFLFRIICHAKVTCTGGADGDATLSSSGALALFANAFFVDPVGVPRADLPPWFLHVRRMLYQSFGLTMANSGLAAYANTGALVDWTPVWQTPLLTTDDGMENDWLFWFDVPLTVHGRELKGLTDLSTPGRKARLAVTVAPGMTISMAPDAGVVDDTFPVNLAAESAMTVVLSDINIMAQQYIYGLQGIVEGRMVDLPIPEADMDVIHVHEYTTNNNVQPGRQARELLPINRTYITALQRWFFDNQTAFGRIDGIATRPDDGSTIPYGLQEVDFWYSGNKNPINAPIAAFLPEVYDKYGLNFPPGNVPFDWRLKPWNADWTDMLQPGGLVDTSAAGGAATVVETYTEGLYTGTTSQTAGVEGATT